MSEWRDAALRAIVIGGVPQDGVVGHPLSSLSQIAEQYWARGALTVLPQPQLQGASGTVIAGRFDGFVAGCLT